MDLGICDPSLDYIHKEDNTDAWVSLESNKRRETKFNGVMPSTFEGRISGLEIVPIRKLVFRQNRTDRDEKEDVYFLYHKQ